MRRQRAQRGMTLIEVLVSTGLLVGGGGALLVSMSQGIILVDYLSDQQVALHAAQSKLEELTATNFDLLVGGSGFLGARTPSAGQRMDMAADLNGDGTPETLLDGSGLNVRIKIVPGQGETFTDAVNMTMVDLHVAASWRTRGRCIGGEDRNCNGLLDAGEDADGDGWMDSPVMVSTRIVRKN